jgi:tetratricopeptide (TPR) repeat protein
MKNVLAFSGRKKVIGEPHLSLVIGQFLLVIWRAGLDCRRDEDGRGTVMNIQTRHWSPAPALGRGEPRVRGFRRLAAFVLVSFSWMLSPSARSFGAVPAGWEARAKGALVRGDLDSARRQAEPALQDASSAAAAHELLGRISFRQKKNEEAIAHFQVANGKGRSGLEMTRDWSAALLALGRHLEARELLEKALSQDSSQTDLRYRLAGSYSSQGMWKEAWPHWEEVFRQGLRHSGVLLQLARARFASGRDVEAVDLLTNFATATTAVDPLFEAGKLLFEKALYRQALAPLQKVWQQKPGTYDAGMYLALSHYLMEEHAASEKVLTAIQSVPATSSEYPLLLGSVRARLGKWDDARSAFEDVTKRFPQRADGYLNFGLFCLERGEKSKAMELFDKASRLESRGNKVLYTIRSRKNCEGLKLPEVLSRLGSAGSELYSQLAEQLYTRQQSGSALEVFLLALEADRRTERAYAGIGRICSEIDSVPEARTFLEKGLELHPQSASLHFNLGLVFQSLGQPNEAVRHLQQAMELRGAQTAPLDWIQLGTAQQAGGNSKDAESSFLKGLSLDPNLAQGHFEMGKLYFQQAAYDRAEQSLEKAIQLDSRLLGAYYQYGLVCMRNGKPEKGKALLSTFHQKKELYAPAVSAIEPHAGP